MSESEPIKRILDGIDAGIVQAQRDDDQPAYRAGMVDGLEIAKALVRDVSRPSNASLEAGD